jgi:hypothetical protein
MSDREGVIVALDVLRVGASVLAILEPEEGASTLYTARFTSQSALDVETASWPLCFRCFSTGITLRTADAASR